jgi:AmpE protein
MTFIITLISLIIERFFHWNQLRNWKWFSEYQRIFSARINNWPPAATLVLSILPLLIAVGLVNLLLSGWLYDSLKIIFGVLVLLYCFGPKNLWLQIYSCLREINKEDPKAGIESVQASFGISFPENSQTFHQAFTRAIFVKAYHRVFAIVFWFVLLGPVGAVFYRTLVLSAEDLTSPSAALAKKAQDILDWIPVRIFTFIFALGGHFQEVFVLWKHSFKLGLEENDQLIADCGIAGLDVMERGRMPEEGVSEKQAIDMLDRVFVMGLVILAMIVLIQ